MRCDSVCSCPRAALSCFMNTTIQMKVARSKHSGGEHQRNVTIPSNAVNPHQRLRPRQHKPLLSTMGRSWHICEKLAAVCPTVGRLCRISTSLEHDVRMNLWCLKQKGTHLQSGAKKSCATPCRRRPQSVQGTHTGPVFYARLEHKPFIPLRSGSNTVEGETGRSTCAPSG